MSSAKYIKIALFFVVLGGAGITYMLLTTNGINRLNTTFYEVVLADATGISTRSKVFLSGVPVGQVKRLSLQGTQARVRFVLLSDIPLYQDAYISRQASSLLGTSVLSLHPGTEMTPLIPPGGTISTNAGTGDMSGVISTVQDIGSQVNLILDEFRTNQMALLAVSLEAIASLTQRIDAQSEAQLDNISRILESTALITERTERLFQSSEGSIAGTFADLGEIMANLRIITAEVAAGKGNFGQAFFDDGVYQNILAATERTEAIAIRLEETLGNISDLAVNANGVVTNAGEIVERALGLGIQIDTNASYGVLAQSAQASASLRIEPRSKDRWYRIGVTSAPDGVVGGSVQKTYNENGELMNHTETSSKFAIDAELARKFGIFTVRGGLLEGTAGFGLDMQALRWMSVSGEVFRFTAGNAPNLRSTVTVYPFFNPDSNYPWNWIYLHGGITNALSDNRDFFVGGGLRFADREVKGLVGLAPVF
ncbi:MAG: MlaD family protein [Treponema sp.]|nr:MlaD family protein [Treponema sp.]